LNSKALDTVFHKWCFKCAECSITLNVKSFKGVGGKVYCATHVPVDRSSTSDGDYTLKSNAEAQKKNTDAKSVQLGAQKGTGETPNNNMY
jgi:LIM and SH3 domain protein 1